MQIDWFTLIAQIVNFVILMALLRLVLYDRVLNIMRQRESDIAARLEHAENKEQEAESHEQALREERDRLDETRDERLASIQKEIEQARQEMLQELREEVQRTRDNWQTSLEREREAVAHDIRERLATLVAASIEQALSDLADESLEERIVDHLLVQTTESEESGWTELREALLAEPDEIMITTAKELDECRLKTIRARTAELLPDDTDVSIRFQVDASMLAGVKIHTAGRTFGWTVEDYVDRLRADFTDAIQHELRQS